MNTFITKMVQIMKYFVTSSTIINYLTLGLQKVNMKLTSREANFTSGE
ncbi:hypothetical protein [Bacillus cereus]|nr:hypothetical protein [Bacillus cereus]